MKYDIGIQTFWNVPNYGTFAQAYALQKVLQQLNDDKDVRQIAHLDEHHFDFYYNEKAFLRSYPKWKKAFWKSFFVKSKKIEEKEKMFFDAYDSIPHTDIINKTNVDNYQFNKVFLGSDIIWDYSQDAFNRDRFLFGGGINAGEINSYAASFGTVALDAELPDYVISAIENMKYVSVRDDKSAQIVEKITGIKPQVVLDPTWLWDFDKDDNIVKTNEEEYILVYGQDFTQEFIDNLISYAKNTGKIIVALDCNDDHYSWCDRLISQAQLSPFQWMGYFKYASAVATSTFHGITFSLIFNKKFAFCKSDFIMAKIDEFLKELELFDLFDKDKNDVFGMLNYDFDYSFINEVIAKKKKISLDFLRKASCNRDGTK